MFLSRHKQDTVGVFTWGVTKVCELCLSKLLPVSYQILKFQDSAGRIFKFQDLTTRILKFQDLPWTILLFTQDALRANGNE